MMISSRGIQTSFLVLFLSILVTGTALTVPVTPSAKKQQTKQSIAFKQINSFQDLQDELKLAKSEKKYVMLDFYADWCTYCKKFEDYIFSRKDVQQHLEGVVLIQANVTKNDARDKELLKHTNVIAPPSILFYGPDGKELREFRIVGDMNAEQFIDRVMLVTGKKQQGKFITP